MDPIFFHQEAQTTSATAAALAVNAPDAARSGAAAHRPSPAGLRVAIQPNISVRGWPTEAGSRALAGFTALEDATVVARLRRAGAAVVGSTHMSEFGFGLSGSGAGRALAARAADVELMLDFAGEARLAAAAAGVCALKPSYGAVSRFGLVGLIPSMEACALLAPDLGSIRALLAAIAGPDEADFSLPAGTELDLGAGSIDPTATTIIGYIAEMLAGLSAEEAEVFHDTLRALRERGLTVRELSMPAMSLFSLVHQIVGSVEASSCLGRYDSVRYGPRAPGAKNWNDMYLHSRGAAFGTLLKSYLMQGAYFQFQRYQAFEDACRIRARLVAEMQRLSGEVDFLVLPVGATTGTTAAGTTAAGTPAAGLFALRTGQLTAKQIDLLLRALPVEVSLVDEHDEVRYYSDHAHRIFPRSPAVIGRQVQHCHPPASLGTVNKILESFRDGSRDEAEFWIEVGGKFVRILYVALRDEQGAYQGTLEVTQDLTRLRTLTGQKRLLDWE